VTAMLVTITTTTLGHVNRVQVECTALVKACWHPAAVAPTPSTVAKAELFPRTRNPALLAHIVQEVSKISFNP